LGKGKDEGELKATKSTDMVGEAKGLKGGKAVEKGSEA